MITGFIYECLFFIPLCVTVSFYVSPFFYKEKEAEGIIISLIAAAFFILVKHLKIKGRAILSGVLVAFLLILWMQIPSGEKIETIVSNIRILWEILLAAGCFLTAVLMERFRIIRGALAAAGLLILVISLVNRSDISRIPVFMTFIFMILIFTDELQRRSEKEGDSEHKKHLAGVSPFILLPFIIVLFIKIPDKPYDWGFVKKISETVKSQYIFLSETLMPGVWDSASPVIGFSDRAAPGGDLSGSERTVMELIALSSGDPETYLAGKTYDSFNGRNWEKKDRGPEDERLMDTLETISAVIGSTGGSTGDIIKRSSVSLKYKDMYTRSIFMPSKYYHLSGKREKRKTEGGDLAFTDGGSARLPYEILFYRINRDSEAFRRFAASPHSINEGLWEKAKEECGINEDISLNDYLKYREELYKIYLPDTELSPKVREYLNESLKGAETDYEKLCRIEDMFAGFKYTETPGELPKSIKDPSKFLDHFILESKEGYCSYYATAFVLLSRASGIPARYVQGFKVPLGKNISAYVSSDHAHAWAEAYIDGAGWFIFEPTPGMRLFSSWETGDAGESAEELKAEEEIEEPTEELPEEKEGFKIRLPQIVIPVISGLALTLFLFALDRILKDRRYKLMDERGKAELNCRKGMDILKRKHLKIGEHETLSEYNLRLKEFIPENLLSFIGTYEEILYSEKDISPEERMALEQGLKDLKNFKIARGKNPRNVV